MFETICKSPPCMNCDEKIVPMAPTGPGAEIIAAGENINGHDGVTEDELVGAITENIGIDVDQGVGHN